jgi:hypothetical protein
MARLSEIGQSLDYKGLEPTGLPAYEGTGYPAAGFGQRRNRVVKFNPKNVGRITRDPINRFSDANTRAQISVLGSLGGDGMNEYAGGDYRREARLVLSYFAGLKENGTQLDSDFHDGLRQIAGLGSVKKKVAKAANAALLLNPLTAIPAAVASLIAQGPVATVDMFVKGTIPQSFIDAVTQKIVRDEKAMNESYNLIQKYKALPAAKQPKNLPDLIKKQEAVFSQLNNAKYYALMLTDFQKSLGFTTGKRLVAPPSLKYIKVKAEAPPNPGFFNAIGAKFDSFKGWLEDKTTRTVTEGLLKKGYILNGVTLGEPITLSVGATAAVIAVSVVAIAAIFAFMKWNGAQELKTEAANTAIEAGNIKKQVVKKQLAEGKIKPEEAAKQLEEIGKAQEAAAGRAAEGGLGDIAKYAAYAVGGIVVIYALGLFTKKG